ncbi:MAG: hypothetical protein EHM20_10525 [Alphaproteobacteria bacterium]|nr:MAG: hypothetical protein EHM20_10525 [Alphaproteobacteria bacterium]
MKKMIALLALTSSLSSMAASDYTCSGTEPFWNLKLEGSKMTFSAAMEDESTTVNEVISRTGAAGMALDFAFVAKTEDAAATIITGECSDGMSDAIYSNHIVYTTGDLVLYGCCNPLN